MDDTLDIREVLKERFLQLPKVVQDAITSADIQKHLRELADTNKLHLDQWEILEDEVMMTLYGVTLVEDLQANIQKHVNVPTEMAATLASNISRIVFEPIRSELESSLSHPDAKAEEEGSDVDKLRTQILSTAPTITAPATPPTLPPTQKVARVPISAAYHAGASSSARASVEDDPYREPPQ